MKKLLIAKYAERPSIDNVNLPKIHYSEEYNLTVTDDGRPLIEREKLGTQTFTRSRTEESDDDPSTFNQLITSTKTFTRTEQSDSDLNDLQLMITKTLTEASIEGTDSDT